jgi:hypothetical protein
MISRFQKPIPHAHHMRPQRLHGFEPCFGGVDIRAVAENHGGNFKTQISKFKEE